MTEIFHQGEREVQAMAGETSIAERHQGLVSTTIHKGLINFIEKQPMVIVSSLNTDKELFASLIIGNFGFLEVADQQTITINTDMITSDMDDVFFSNIRTDPGMGALFIEPDTRRRLRVNGTGWLHDGLLKLTTSHAYPNCPKYIQRRVISVPEYFEKVKAEKENGFELSENILQQIRNANTFYAASAGAEGQLDASHRGGNTGFVEILDDHTLRIPDYPGNSMFNTLGNMIQNPNMGLLFIDYEKQETLQLTGTGALQFDQRSEADLQKTKGTGRFWLFKTARWIRTINHHQVQWDFLDYSPFNP